MNNNEETPSKRSARKKMWMNLGRVRRKLRLQKHHNYGSRGIAPTQRRLDDAENASSRSDSGSLSLSLHSPIQRIRSLDNEVSETDWIVPWLESHLRYLCILVMAYILGTRFAEYNWVASKLLEYLVVAWLTCAGILLATRLSPKRTIQNKEERTPLLSRETERLLAAEEARDALLPELDEDDVVPTTESFQVLSAAMPAMPHPALEPFFIVDKMTKQRITPNGSTPHRIESDYFEGYMMVLIRTPDCDDPLAVSTPETAAASSYLSDKQRRFEFQFQLRFKKIPKGRFYFACELDEPLKLGMIQRAFVGAAMAFVKTANNNFQYSITGNEFGKPFMAFPVEEGMNRVVSTPPDRTPPVLGQEITEDEESLKRRRKGAMVEWNLEDTYTFALWSAYIDFLQWKCINLPGIKPFHLSSVIGRQAFNVTLYEMSDGNEKPGRPTFILIADLELCNAIESGVGPFSSQWITQHGGALVKPQNAEFFQEDEDIAALGEGIYVRSGDSIVLREASPDDIEGCDDAGVVAYAGGFAVLQQNSTSTIVIEKYEKARTRSTRSRTPLIQNGDSVLFKLITRVDGEVDEIRYLTIHRGWWLKWVINMPSKNGIFTIHTQGAEYGAQVERFSATYLTLGGSFRLSHKRWSRYQVGVAAEGSATYGGRMLGLYAPKSDAIDDEFESDEGDFEETGPMGEKAASKWMRPIWFQAFEALPGEGTPLMVPQKEENSFDARVLPESLHLFFSEDHLMMDAPCWVEMMNRTDRIRQLAYAVRVFPRGQGVGSDITEAPCQSFFRLRTGRDLAVVTRAGLNWKVRGSSTLSMKREQLDSNPVSSSMNRSLSPARRQADLNISNSDLLNLATTSFDDSVGSLKDEQSCGDASSGPDWSVDDIGGSFPGADGVAERGESQHTRSKSRDFIGKLAKSVKTGTTKTGKSVVKQGVKVGKGTVNAGKKVGQSTKAIITGSAPRRKNPPSKEPKAAKVQGRKRKEQDLDVGVTRSLKQIMERATRGSFKTDSAGFLAGELSASEQSCRTMSKLLCRMSSLPASSDEATSFSDLLVSLVNRRSELDAAFLTGGAIEIGVVPGNSEVRKGPLMHECIVIRCLWESHWREEWCGIYEKGLSLYAPLTKAPCLEMSLSEIEAFRPLELDKLSPLPGCPILVIETSPQCFYLAFRDDDARNLFRDRLAESIYRFTEAEDFDESTRSQDLRNARFWQAYIESSLSSGRGRWAEVSSGNKTKARHVLNNRRAAFDLDPLDHDLALFVGALLSTALSFSTKKLEEHPEDLSRFLDGTSQLKTLNLASLDFSSPSTFCMFVNLYHCLLQHALLLSINGPLSKRSFGHFFKTSCYEIGGDIFSLAELHACVIRGNMTRPLSNKPPAVEIPRKSNSYRYYALGQTTPRVNFLLNTGDKSFPRQIPVLSTSCLDAQLNTQVGDFLRQNISLDLQRRVIFIPKICEIYRNDFAIDQAGAAGLCLHYCLSFLNDSETAATIRKLLEDECSVTIKYNASSDQYHSTLQLRDTPVEFGTQLEPNIEF